MFIYHSHRTARGPRATMLYGLLSSVLHWSWTKVCDGKTKDNLVHIRTSLICLFSAVAEQCWKSRVLILQPFVRLWVQNYISFSSEPCYVSFWVLLFFTVEGTWCHTDKEAEKMHSSYKFSLLLYKIVSNYVILTTVWRSISVSVQNS